MIDIIAELEDYGIAVIVHDPLADAGEARAYYNVDLKSLESLSGVDALVIAVAHSCYREMGLSGLARIVAARRSVR